MNHRPIFHNKDNERLFHKQGYFTLQLLGPEDIVHLLSVFETLDPGVGNQFYSTIDSTNLDYRHKVDQQIRARISEKVTGYFIGYTPIVFNFIVKEPGGDSEVFLHVDVTHVDESKYQTVNVWCPLVDTTPDNGSLFVLPGSQTLPYPPRGYGMPHPYSEFHELVKPRMKRVPLRAGEAIFYDNRLMHRSDPNRSSSSRPAIIMGMLPNEAEKIVHMHTPEMPDGQVEVFELSTDFYLNFDRDKRPEGIRSMGLIDYEPVKFSPEVFANMLDRIGKEQNPGLWNKILNKIILLMKP